MGLWYKACSEAYILYKGEARMICIHYLARTLQYIINYSFSSKYLLLNK